MSRRQLGVSVAAALALTAVLIWRLATSQEDDLSGLDPDAARIEQHRREGNVEALAAEIEKPDAQVAALAVDALGRLGPKALPHIRRAIRDTRRPVRERAVLALARTASRGRTNLLAERAVRDEAASVRAAAVTALARLRAHDQMESLLDALGDGDRMVRQRAAQAFIRITGVDFGFRADVPPDDPAQLELVTRMRSAWKGMKARVLRYHAVRGKSPGR